MKRGFYGVSLKCNFAETKRQKTMINDIINSWISELELHNASSVFIEGFKFGAEKAANLIESQPLTVYCVHSSEDDIEGVFRSEEKAQEHIDKLKKHHDVEFWIEPTII